MRFQRNVWFLKTITEFSSFAGSYVSVCVCVYNMYIFYLPICLPTAVLWLLWRRLWEGEASEVKSSSCIWDWKNCAPTIPLRPPPMWWSPSCTICCWGEDGLMFCCKKWHRGAHSPLCYLSALSHHFSRSTERKERDASGRTVNVGHTC